MAKLTLQRFPDPTPEYEAQNFNELIRVLEALIQQLNTTYTVDSENKSEAEAWYFSRWVVIMSMSNQPLLVVEMDLMLMMHLED